MIDRLSDCLSPVLVKESRQGLRSRAFVLVFVVIQPLMILFLLFSMVNREMGNHNDGTETLFWGTLFVAISIIMPLRGLTSITEEVKAKSFELLKITHLSAFRIIAGKWTALYTQILLLTVAIIPYIAVRYFLGGVDLVGNIAAMVVMLLMAAAVLAVALLISSFTSMLLRVLALVAIVPFLFSMTSVPFMIIHEGLASMGPTTTLEWLSLLAGTVVAVLLVLRITASRIAAVDDSQTAAKRVLWLVAIALAGAVSLFVINDNAALVYIMLGLTPLMILEAFVEQQPPRGQLHSNTGTRRLLRPLRWLFSSPGWLAGTAFYLVAMIICAVLIEAIDGFEFDALIFLITIATGACFPVFVTRTFYGGGDKALGIYLSVVVGCLLLSGLIGAIQTLALRINDSLLAGVVPVTSIFILNPSSADADTRLLLSSFGFLITFVFFILALGAEWRRQAKEHYRRRSTTANAPIAPAANASH